MLEELAGMKWHAVSVTGRRECNEDACCVKVHGPSSATFVVCDGLGGHEGGDVAAQLVSKLVAEVAPTPGEDLAALARRAIEVAQQRLAAEKARRGLNMYTTAVALWVSGRHAVVAHVGDSRAYLWRNGVLAQLTEDHRLGRHTLSRTVGGRPSRGETTPDVRELTLAPGDVLALTTDGVHDSLTPEALSHLLSLASTSRPTPLPAAEASQQLVSEADEAGSTDNLTALVVQVE